MQFRKIRKALTRTNREVRAEELPIRARGPWYCPSCDSPLLLHRGHTDGAYFVHNIEYSEHDALSGCEYQVHESGQRPASEFVRNASAALRHPQPTMLAEQDYWCALCQHEYFGGKNCPKCRESIYTTELRNVDCRNGDSMYWS